MAERFETVSFLSDYGTDDEFVGVVKSVIRSIAPHAVVVDLTHGIAPYDVRGASLALARAVQYLAPGVVLAVVDPGVGSERRAVAVEAAEAGSVFVGPDNGLLASAVAMGGGATRAVALTDERYHLPAPGPTFAGRDIFAPAVAHLCNGVALSELGEPVEPETLLPGVLPLTRDEAGALVAEVLWVDRFGNVQLNVDPDELLVFDDPVSLSFHDRVQQARRAASYSAIPAGALGLVVDAYGLISIAANRHSAAGDLGLAAGDTVTLREADDNRVDAGVTSPVSLSATRSRS
ncbi:MAG: SAM-dependent chlorinase/fluorinase [Actinobacteria bacterium]|nr:SAM-dependent chlorinase/fluorinase [Actinomycetota bacterium]MBW3642601.1 SAM-dependent chlorinase/fluorinase [Actinomycetota bacterium]